MNAQGFRVCVSAVVALGLASAARTEEDAEPFVRRTFGFFVAGSDLGPDYFLSDDSIAVVTGAEEETDSANSPIHFAPCPDVNGDLADTTWVNRTTRHVTRGNPVEAGTFFWLLTAETPEPPPPGVVTLTGDGSPLILSQEVVLVRRWEHALGCPEGRSTDFVAGSVGARFIIVTALFNR